MPPGGRHGPPPSEATLTVADVIAARNDYHRGRRRPDAQLSTVSWPWSFGLPLTAAAIGLVVGAAIPPPALLPGPIGRASNALGWVYLACWVYAEYPPLYLNYVKKATSGDSLDHVVYYIIGDVSYTAFTTVLLWSPACQSSKDSCRGQTESIHLNDALFSIHSAACTLALLGQLLLYSQRRAGPSLQCWVVIVSFLVIGGGGLVLALQDSNYLTLPGFLYGASFLRLGSCVMEQLPGSESQMWPERMWKRRVHASTHWALLAGGCFSIAQQIVDTSCGRMWAIMTRNLTKLLLAVLTCFFSAAMLGREYDILARWRGAELAPPREPELTEKERVDRIEALNEALVP